MISKDELQANVKAIQALATLQGMPFEKAALTFFEDLRKGVTESKDAIETINDALRNL